MELSTPLSTYRIGKTKDPPPRLFGCISQPTSMIELEALVWSVSTWAGPTLLVPTYMLVVDSFNISVFCCLDTSKSAMYYCISNYTYKIYAPAVLIMYVSWRYSFAKVESSIELIISKLSNVSTPASNFVLCGSLALGAYEWFCSQLDRLCIFVNGIARPKYKTANMTW